MHAFNTKQEKVVSDLLQEDERKKNEEDLEIARSTLRKICDPASGTPASEKIKAAQTLLQWQGELPDDNS